MSDEQQHMPWSEGLPTKPDVDAPRAKNEA